MTYSQKLRDPRWQRKRLEILQRDNWRCTACASEEKTLHVHHRFYISGRMPWEYLNSALLTLCEDCHEMADLWTEGDELAQDWEYLVDVVDKLGPIEVIASALHTWVGTKLKVMDLFHRLKKAEHA